MNYRPLWWVLLSLGGVVAVLAIMYAIQSGKRKQVTQEEAVDPSKPPVSEPTVPSGPTVPTTPTIPTTTPPYVPPTGNQGTKDTWVDATTWKANELFKGYRNYSCEVTNALIEMSDIQITALVKQYFDWYGQPLPTLYCQGVKSSGCWTDWNESLHKKACKRLDNLKI